MSTVLTQEYLFMPCPLPSCISSLVDALDARDDSDCFFLIRFFHVLHPSRCESREQPRAGRAQPIPLLRRPPGLGVRSKA